MKGKRSVVKLAQAAVGRKMSARALRRKAVALMHKHGGNK